MTQCCSLLYDVIIQNENIYSSIFPTIVVIVGKIGIFVPNDFLHCVFCHINLQ